ncbi:PilC/PilY family type IV pilus protein [Lysobacter arenosi]|uniref:PilC/PilY family type IV pilus protein n=1 Tax=Lysobacter arenosi TaxID=2795387 RepID=UPI001FD6DF57|nr:PilC/PilY family type IV pilus protein [Lysobacter arenosi]
MTIKTMDGTSKRGPGRVVSARRPGTLRRLTPFFVTLCATLVAAPGHAVDIPVLPMQTGVAYPAANVMLILDDSLSMEGDTLPYKLSIDTGASEDEAYTANSLAYNPATTYSAWLGSNSEPVTGGTTFDTAYSDASLLSGSANLANTTQTFYIPKPTATNLTVSSSYYRYQILSGTGRVVQAEWLSAAPTTPAVALTSDSDLRANRGAWALKGTSGADTAADAPVAARFSFTIPEVEGKTVSLTVTTSGNDADAHLYVRHSNDGSPSTNQGNNNNSWRCKSETTGSSAETCTASTAQPGVWNLALKARNNSNSDSFTGVSFTVSYTVTENNTLGCTAASTSGNAWRNCTRTTPQYKADGSKRTEQAEKDNYATWYSYHRTRMKSAKNGASTAFAGLQQNIRVGLIGLYPPGDNKYQGYKIPVTHDSGLFKDTNRSQWFTKLHEMDGKNTTPLRKALNTVGKYFSETADDGPYGPATGSGATKVQLACRQNFAILTTDGYWNNFNGTDDPDNNYTHISGDEEDGVTITGPNNGDFKYTKQAPYWYNPAGDADDGLDTTTLADVAMHYWKTDLRTLENKVPSSTANPAFWQHMVTFGISLGARGLMTDAQIKAAKEKTAGAYWVQPKHATNGDDNPQNIDDLQHAAVNSRGTFVSAQDPEQFAKALKSALATVAERLGSASNVSTNTSSLQGTDGRVYQASYTSGKWAGELAAHSVSSAGIDLTPAWIASEHVPAVASRNIKTWEGSEGVAFPTTDQVTALGAQVTSIFGSTSTVTGAQIASYIRGDRSKETNQTNGVMRERSTVLGDIVNSSPNYVADSKTIFVGANDGMLHAFKTVTESSGPVAGTELFAYVPRGVSMTDLAQLANPLYVHKYFVDGPITVSNTTQTPGKNYLVGALGRGGKGVYGLDVTTPGSFDDDDVLWDLTGSAAPTNMGLVLGEPLMVKLNDASKTKAVVVSNGINSSTGTASLFVINVATGDVIREIDTGVTGDNGLSAPRGADLDGNGTVDYVYAGDLQGNVWKFDLRSSASASWSKSKLFTAMDDDDKAQPITAGVALARNPLTGQIWIFVGTGSFLTENDRDSNDVQSMYGIIDDGGSYDRGDLAEREIMVVTTKDGRKVRAFQQHIESLESGNKGWYIDLDDPEPGERIVSNPRVSGTALITASLIPPDDETTTDCESGGSGYINALDAFTGTSLSESYFDSNGNGDSSDDTVADADGNQLPIGSVDLGVGMPTLPTVIDSLLVVGGSKGTLGSVTVNPQGGQPRRVSWREIQRN